jgi:hypothetical protein
MDARMVSIPDRGAQRTIPQTPGGEHSHERSRPQYQSDAGEPALRRKNPLGRIVPLAGGARQGALPHARRCAGIRIRALANFCLDLDLGCGAKLRSGGSRRSQSRKLLQTMK